MRTDNSGRAMITAALRHKIDSMMRNIPEEVITPDQAQAIKSAYDRVIGLMDEDGRGDGYLFAALIDVGLFYLLLQPVSLARFELALAAENLKASGVVDDIMKEAQAARMLNALGAASDSIN